MKIVEIPKRNGKSRVIYIPNREEKPVYQSLVGTLSKKAERFCPNGIAHGFMRYKSPVSNALPHVGHLFTTCFDLKDFFDSVREDHLRGKLSEDELKIVLVDGAPRQGLPTSPPVANIAASDLDKAILKWRDKKKLDIIYTRYADDLSFSYDDPSITKLLKEVIPQIVGRCGFKVNPSKTHTMSASNGRRRVCGIAVGEDGIYPTRRAKRRLRAALHQGNKNKARGLEEWCKLKPPRDRNTRKAQETKASDVETLCSVWRLPKIDVSKLPDKGDDLVTGDIIITGDPAYTLGMSTYTTGWTSCMAQPNGQYRNGVLFWLFIRGTKVAALLSQNTKVFGGVERRTMRARCLVHELRNGVICYDRIYGNPNDKEELEKELRRLGYVSCGTAKKRHKGERVVGHAPDKYRPYLDSLSASTAKASAGFWKGRKVRVVKV